MAYEKQSQSHKQLVDTELGAEKFFVPGRLSETELLDQGEGTFEDVRRNLQEMWTINVTFGGIRDLTHHLYSRLQEFQSGATVADLGTGSGQLAHMLSTWAMRHHIKLRTVLVDIAPRHLQIANKTVAGHSDTALVQADACRLPFAPDSIDYFVSSLFLHHLEPDRLVALLADLYQRAKRGIIMSDITRSTFSLIGFRIIQPLLARHYLTRHDGILSIRRAYTPDELRVLAHRAGLSTAQIYHRLPWQMTLVAEKPHV